MSKKVIYYHDKRGKKPVKDFIDKLDTKTKAKILARLGFLGEHWARMKRPLIDYLGDGIYELRLQFSPNKIRIIYAYMFKNYIVLLHGIMKKTSKFRDNDKLKAKKRMIDFQIQQNEGRIKLR